MSRLPPHLLHLVADADTVWPEEDAEKINSDGARVLWWSGFEVQFFWFLLLIYKSRMKHHPSFVGGKNCSSLLTKAEARSAEGMRAAPLCLFCIKCSIWSFSPLPNVQMRADCREEAADSLIQKMQGVWARPWHVLSRGRDPWPFPKDTDPAFPHSFHTIQSRALVSCPLARWLSDKGGRDMQWTDNKHTQIQLYFQ